MKLAGLLLFSALAFIASASPSEDAIAACESLHSSYPQNVVWDPNGAHGKEAIQDTLEYKVASEEYWNGVNANNHPSCAFFPSDAEQVSAAVKQLNQHPEAQFALKGGGHNFNANFSSTDGGVLISFNQNLANITRSEDGESFRVGAGARWGDVYSVTSKTNQVVVGGRLANIGVAGLTLGGGLSYYSAQYGLACDNVINFQVVLPNGTIANANQTSNADLWWALRGGGNRFGIVTQFTLKAHPLGVNGRIWGGIRAYKSEQQGALFSALARFIREYPDAKAAVIPTFDFGRPDDFISTPGFFFFYDGPSPPPNAFAGLEDVETFVDMTKNTTYVDLTNVIGGARIYGAKGASRVNTFPSMPPEQMQELLQAHWDVFRDHAKNDSTRNIDLQLATFTPQPLSVRIAKASAAGGGNALGLDPNHGDRVWVENDLIWANPVCNEACPDYLRLIADNVTAEFDKRWKGVKPTNYTSGDVDFVSSNPLFMNDAAYYQDVYSSYGAPNKAKLLKIAEAYDPDNFMNRQGGWKFRS